MIITPLGIIWFNEFIILLNSKKQFLSVCAACDWTALTFQQSLKWFSSELLPNLYILCILYTQNTFPLYKGNKIMLSTPGVASQLYNTLLFLRSNLLAIKCKCHLLLHLLPNFLHTHERKTLLQSFSSLPFESSYRTAWSHIFLNETVFCLFYPPIQPDCILLQFQYPNCNMANPPIFIPSEYLDTYKSAFFLGQWHNL